MLTPILSFEQVCFGHDKNRTLHDISFNIYPGTVHGLLGPNGAGKTTTMNLACGLLCPEKGRITCMGRDPYLKRHELASRIGHLPEVPPLYDDMTVRETLEFYVGLHSGPRSRVEELLKQLGLQSQQHQLNGQLSKGNKQKVGMALALSSSPHLLILDEPTSGLDPASIVEFRQILRTLVSTGVTILISTHILSEVQTLCDSLTVLQQGKVIASGLIDELQSTLLIPVSLELQVAPASQEHFLNLAREHQWRILSQEPHHLTVTLNQEADIPALIKSCVDNGIELYQVKKTQAQVEQLFMQLTRGHHVQELPRIADRVNH